jgi:hypothetical protein
MDIDFLLQFKNNPEVQNFNINLPTYYQPKIKNETYNKKTSLNPIKKDSIVNKYNLILNKLSETNFNNIITEFIDNINYITNDEYEEFQKVIYLKILSDFNYINLYLRFLELINYVYNNVLQYNLEYLITIVNLKFKYDYLNENIIDDKYIFIKNLIQHRTNNIILIKNLYTYQWINNVSFYENIILDNENYIEDIYYWKPEMNDTNINKIKEILLTNLTIRDKVLLENILTNSNNTEFDYIINDYIDNNDMNNILNYINNNCIDNIAKIKLCKNIIDKYMELNKNDKIINLLKELLKRKIIHKNDLNIKNTYNNDIIQTLMFLIN